MAGFRRCSCIFRLIFYRTGLLRVFRLNLLLVFVQPIIIVFIFVIGEMAEWSIAAVLKTVEVKASGGSNPSLSALLG